MSFRTTIGICGTFVGLFWIYVYCYIGNRITYNLLGIAVWAYRPAWHIYPLKLRVFIILIICRSQKVLNFNGLRLIFCNLVTFTSVREYFKLILFYFMLFYLFTDIAFNLLLLFNVAQFTLKKWMEYAGSSLITKKQMSI